MRLIDVNAEVICNVGDIKSTIKLTAIFQDTITTFPAEIILKDWIYVDATEIREVFNELKKVQTEHPFFQLKLCESPLELKFFVYSLKEIPNLKPQVVFGPYRIDLAIPEKKVALEVDGHEFHKSRQQRTHNAKRDRYLQLHGWHVIRFTGTEVHNDVLGCIREAKEIIETVGLQ
jgi:very-short-patch-repair endonuclease